MGGQTTTFAPVGQTLAANAPRGNHGGIAIMQEFDPHVLEEQPIPPPEEFSKKARIGSLEEYRELYAAAAADPETFWGEQAKLLHWFEAPKKVLDWNPPQIGRASC